MLFRLIRAEQMKLKRSPVWIAFLLMPVIPAILGTLNYLNNLEILQSDWYSLWTQHTLFTCYFFLPVMIGVYCTYVMRQEQEQHNWNKVLTMPVSRSLIVIAKLITVSVMIFLSEVWIGTLFVLSGKWAGIPAPVPVFMLAGWCLFGTLGGMVMASVQLAIALLIKSFALPVGISFAGGISGLLFLAKGYGHIWPYALLAYGMRANAPQKMMESGYPFFFLTCVGMIAGLTLISSMILNKKNI